MLSLRLALVKGLGCFRSLHFQGSLSVFYPWSTVYLFYTDRSWIGAGSRARCTAYEVVLLGRLATTGK